MGAHPLGAAVNLSFHVVFQSVNRQNVGPLTPSEVKTGAVGWGGRLRNSNSLNEGWGSALEKTPLRKAA